MKKNIIRKILIASLGIVTITAIVLGVHIYNVTRPKVATETTVSMARINFKQNITQDDVVKITRWFYQQKGADRMMCFPETRNAIITFYPVKMNANEFAKSLSTQFNINAERYMPTKEEMMQGCPVSMN